MLKRDKLLEINPDFKKLFDINPEGKAFGSGNCLSCAAELANVLIHDTTRPVTQITDVNANHYESEALAGKQKLKQFSDPQSLLDLIRDSQPGSVFVVDIEEHVYNLFKNFDGKVLLLDADKHIFKQIKNPEDFKIPADRILDDPSDYEKLRDPEKKLYDLYYNGDGVKNKPSVYSMGVAHPSWNHAMPQHVLSDSKTGLFGAQRNDTAAPGQQEIKIGRGRR